jgi:hypothetical protein
MVPSQTTSSQEISAPWAIFLQYANHREVLLTDGAWMNEDTATRPDLLFKPRTFDRYNDAATYLRCNSVDKRAIVSRVKVQPGPSGRKFREAQS